jgi:hypothetical protein
MKVYEWLDEAQSKRWVCPHMEALLTELAQSGNSIRAVGLVNYRSPEAIVFASQPLQESVVESAIIRTPLLSIARDGLGRIAQVTCATHPVSLQFDSDQCGLEPNKSFKPNPLRGSA